MKFNVLHSYMFSLIKASKQKITSEIMSFTQKHSRPESTMTEICSSSDYSLLPRIFIGNKYDAQNYDLLKENGIHAIINCAYELENMEQYSDIAYIILPLKDCSSYELLYDDHFIKAFEFLCSAKKNSHAVLVHCGEGRSRSATIVLGALMHSTGMTFDTAYATVAEKRPISPNMGFCLMLREYFEDSGTTCNYCPFHQNNGDYKRNEEIVTELNDADF